MMVSSQLLAVAMAELQALQWGMAECNGCTSTADDREVTA